MHKSGGGRYGQGSRCFQIFKALEWLRVKPGRATEQQMAADDVVESSPQAGQNDGRVKLSRPPRQYPLDSRNLPNSAEQTSRVDKVKLCCLAVVIVS